MHVFSAREERFLGLEDQLASPDTVGVVIVPVPFDKTASYGKGSGSGPAALLRASQHVELFDCDLGFDPSQASGGIGTILPLRVGGVDDGKSVSERLERVVSYWLSMEKLVITLGGEHTGVVGAMSAHACQYANLTILQLDAHSDTRTTYMGDSWNHACTMARVLDFHKDVVQVGIRSETKEEREFANGLSLPLFRCASIQQNDRLAIDWVTPIIEACSGSVYVSIDLDVLDPSIMPATGTPEPGGMTWEQIDRLLGRLCEERRVVGFDVSELAPIQGLAFPEFTAAKLVYRFIGHIFKKGACLGDWKLSVLQEAKA